MLVPMSSIALSDMLGRASLVLVDAWDPAIEAGEIVVIPVAVVICVAFPFEVGNLVSAGRMAGNDQREFPDVATFFFGRVTIAAWEEDTIGIKTAFVFQHAECGTRAGHSAPIPDLTCTYATYRDQRAQKHDPAEGRKMIDLSHGNTLLVFVMVA